MKMKQLSDSERRNRLNYEELLEANRLLARLVESASGNQRREWGIFSVLVQRACRIPPGPEGADTPGCEGFEVGREWRNGTETGVVKALRICGTLREIYGLVQIDSHDHGLVWLKLGQLAQ